MTDIVLNFKTAGDQVVVGALREIGSAAANFLGEAAGLALGFARDSFQGAIEAQAGIDKLAGSIKRLGDFTPVTMQGAQDLAAQFKDLVGGSDDMVLAMTNVGLRFDEIRESTFPSFIQGSADLAATLGIDGTRAAEILGKTLQDLSKDGAGSIGRLKAAGVALTKEQEDQIKIMVKAGDVAGAQKLLLDALAATTGGAAAAAAGTFAGQMKIFQESVKDAGEGVAMALLPALTDLAKQVIPALMPIIKGLADGAATWISGTFVPAFQDAVAWVQANWPAVQAQLEAFWAAAQPILTATADYIQNQLLPAVSAFVAWVVENWPALQAGVLEFWAIIQPIFTAYVDYLQNTLLPAIQSAIAYVIENWPAIQAAIAASWEAIKPVLEAVVAFIANVAIPAYASLVNWVVANWPAIAAVIGTVMQAIQTVITTVLAFVQAFWAEWGATIVDNVNFFVTQWQTLFAMFQAAFSGDWYKFGQLLRQYMETAWKQIQDNVTAVVNWFLTKDWGAIGTSILQGIANGITSGTQWVIDAAKGAAEAAYEAAKGFLHINSPSRLFAGLGAGMMEGMAMGVNANSAMPAAAAVAAAARTATTVNNFNLSLTANGTSQGVQTDFILMRAMAGV